MNNDVNKYMKFTMIYYFCPEKMKIKSLQKLVLSLNDKKEYTVYKIGLKQLLYRGLILFGLT